MNRMLRILKFSQTLTYRNQILFGYVKRAAEFRTNVNNVRNFSDNFDVQAWIGTLDEAQRKKVRFIQAEVTLLQLNRKQIPKLEDMRPYDFQYIADLYCRYKRYRYYNYLFKLNEQNATKKLKREIRRRVNEERMMHKGDEPKHIEYDYRGFNKGAFPITDQTKNTRFTTDETNLIFDCGYSNDMTLFENWETARQLIYCFGLNRSHRTPFSLHYCNMNMESLLWKHLNEIISTLKEKPLPLEIHTQDLIEIYPRDKLVLLTPDSPNILREFDPNVYYVISALVGRSNEMPYTLEKARKLDLQTARLPMELYPDCRIKYQTLTLDQMLQLMLQVKFFGVFHIGSTAGNMNDDETNHCKVVVLSAVQFLE